MALNISNTDIAAPKLLDLASIVESPPPTPQDKEAILSFHSVLEKAESKNDYSVIHGSSGHDIISGTLNPEKIYGGFNDDLIYGGGGSDHLFGERGLDILHGGDGDDILKGGLHADKLYGGVGDDNFHGGTGNDTLYGGLGDDVFYPGSGINTIYGGRGDDTLVLKKPEDPEPEDPKTENTVHTFHGGSGIDRVYAVDYSSDQFNYVKSGNYLIMKLKEGQGEPLEIRINRDDVEHISLSDFKKGINLEGFILEMMQRQMTPS